MGFRDCTRKLIKSRTFNFACITKSQLSFIPRECNRNIGQPIAVSLAFYGAFLSVFVITKVGVLVARTEFQIHLFDRVRETHKTSRTRFGVFNIGSGKYIIGIVLSTMQVAHLYTLVYSTLAKGLQESSFESPPIGSSLGMGVHIARGSAEEVALHNIRSVIGTLVYVVNVSLQL